MFVEDYMTSQPHVIATDALLSDAQELIHKHHIHHIPVVDHAGRLTGIISDRDVRSAVGYDESRGAKLRVSEVMTHDPVTIAAKSALDEALSVFITHRFGALPVVRFTELVGMISRSDLLRAFYLVLGLDVTGRRVEIALPNGTADLVHAFKALENFEDSLISAVVSRMRRDGGEPSLYLRIADDCAVQVERHLREATMIVLEPEHT